MRKRAEVLTALKLSRAAPILTQIFILVLCIAILFCGLAFGTPRWLQLAGFIFFAVYLFGGSLYLLLRPKQDRRQNWGQMALLPRSWQRWFLDEPVGKRHPRSEYRR